MLPQKRTPTHLGGILQEKALQPHCVPQVAFTVNLAVPVHRVNELFKGKRCVTPETAWLLSQALGITLEFWMNLQAAHDLGRTRLANLVKPLRVAA